MIGYIEYLNIPTKVAIALIGTILILQFIGELLEFKGKTVPELLKIRKYFARKKREREMMHEVSQTLTEVKQSFKEFNSHYSSDNIRMRDEWMRNVNKRLEAHDEWREEFNRKLDKNNQDTVALLIDSKRNTIINFAAFVVDEKNSVTREQFNRIFKLYEEYENIIMANGMTNGEVDIAYRIIKESYETHLRNQSFIEDVRGYNR